MNEEDDIQAQLTKTMRRLTLISTLQCALRFYVGAAVTGAIIFAGYTGWYVFLAVALVGLAYGHLNTVYSSSSSDST